MLVERSSISTGAAEVALDVEDFRSGLLSEHALLNYALLPTTPESRERLGTASDPWVSRRLQRNAVALAQGANAIAVNRGMVAPGGIGRGALEAVSRLVGQEAFDRDVNVKALVTEGTKSVIDTVLAESLGSVPFVGSAAGLLWSIGVAIFTANGRESRLPPMLRMDPVADERATNDAVAILKREGGDWTPIFLPTTEGLWGLQLEGDYDDPTYLSARQPMGEYSEGVWRLGCAPGDLFYVDAGFQSRVKKGNVTIPNNARSPRYRNVLQTGENPESMHRLAFPLGNWFPSLSALGRSVWALVGSRQSTAMFQVDAARVASEWDEFADATSAFRKMMDDALGRRVKNISKDHKRRVIARTLGNYAAAMHTLRTRDEQDRVRELSQDQLLAAALDPAKRAGSDTVGRQAVAHARRLELRQKQASGSALNALVSHRAPAFATNQALRDHFLAERKALLKAGKFDGLPLDQVPDPGLRQQLEERAKPPGGELPTTFADPGSVERMQRLHAERNDTLKAIDKPLGFGGYGAEEDPEDESGGGYGLALAGLVATAGIAAGGIALARRRR